jgi:formamidopyrimidine-DNA glycosylase
VPESPEITVYVERLQKFVAGHRLERVRIAHPFLLRTAALPITALEGRLLTDVERIGKRIVFAFEGAYFLVLHLMLSGRLAWLERGAGIPRKRGLAALDFPDGTLLIEEPSSQKRASLHLVRGREALAGFDQGGVDPLDATLDAFSAAIRSENHTLKRALTDQSIVSGIGNAYSDEILHRARMSPFLLTESLTDEQAARLHEAARETLLERTARLRQDAGDGFPQRMEARRDDLAVHGRYGEPCAACGTPVQRIRYATRETNYCPRCQTGGRLLADRALSRLLRDDWPRTIEELEERRR